MDGRAEWVEQSREQHLYVCSNPSCTVYEFLEKPPEEVNDV